MDLGGVFFFIFLGVVIIVPKLLRHQERERLHDIVRLALERGQPVPPELIAALAARRRRDYDPLLYAGGAGWRTPAAAPPPPPPAGGEVVSEEARAGEDAASFAPYPPLLAPVFPDPARRDLRRGLVWLGVGLGLVTAGVACYAGLYEVGGAQETLSLFCAFAAIPLFVGLTYLGLWRLERRRNRL